MAIITDPAKSYTLNQFIALKAKDDITYNNFSILESSQVEPNIVYSIDNIIHNYIEDIEEYVNIVRVTEIDRLKYQYKPKLLCYDIYGSTEIYFILMALNGLYNIKDFTLEDYVFKALYSDEMFNFASKVYNAEEEILKLNRRKLNII